MIKLLLFILWLCGVGFGIAISILIDYLTNGIEEKKILGEDNE